MAPEQFELAVVERRLDGGLVIALFRDGDENSHGHAVAVLECSIKSAIELRDAISQSLRG